jgi:superfamily II DNA/RNA helicase
MDYVLYLHRSGRCSRFGRNGLCFNLITNEQELSDLLSIGDYYNIDINQLEDINMVERLIEENLSNTPGV